MNAPIEPKPNTAWKPGEEGALDVAVLFVDLVSSSEFASVLPLQDYAAYVRSYEQLCEIQCRHFFEVVHKGKFVLGRDYEFHTVGDELVVFLHSGYSANDVYQLICLAISLKCGWLGTQHNAQRIANGMASAELAAGINFGRVWARYDGEEFHKCGFAINVAKRIESLSREGHRFRISVSDPAFKQVNLRVRNLAFGPRQLLPMKGVVVPTGVYEIYESFVDMSRRIEPELRKSFLKVADQALRSNSFDLWIHSCLQVWQEKEQGKVSEEALEMAKHVLSIDPENAVALYYAAQGYREKNELETARQYLNDLVAAWPKLADGWLELSRLYKLLGNPAAARENLFQARRLGVTVEEEELPEK